MLVVHVDVDAAVASSDAAITSSVADVALHDSTDATGPAAGGHVNGSSKANKPAATADASVQLLEWLDRTLRYLNNSTLFKEAVLLAVVLTPKGADLGSGWLQPGGAMLEPGQPVRLPPDSNRASSKPLSLQQQQADTSGPSAVVSSSSSQSSSSNHAGHLQASDDDPCFAVVRPKQSFQASGIDGHLLDMDLQRPSLVLRRLPGVIRRDGCSSFSLLEWCRCSGELAIPADRLLPEIAYKVGRAPKYGA